MQKFAYLASFAFAFAAAQSALLISTEFWPLQELLALLQADWPLQEFTPVQCTVSSAAAAVPTKAVPKSIAAAVATATPVVFFARINMSSLKWSLQFRYATIATGQWGRPGGR